MKKSTVLAAGILSLALLTGGCSSSGSPTPAPSSAVPSVSTSAEVTAPEQGEGRPEQNRPAEVTPPSQEPEAPRQFGPPDSPNDNTGGQGPEAPRQFGPPDSPNDNTGGQGAVGSSCVENGVEGVVVDNGAGGFACKTD
ncbi:hypothetical protein GOHSU_22_00570 [Gordonia hirsuta DSM 44140 = NBRC 16056]|uniref:Lipoprotein n=1 Tax=Gordonia hirsuta DSM 44140 = NBRC 16056 TaxID=1121927 RepID=L7LC05_9ACTN|nr:hypothetical protein [Gordonia hirsuta]GAC57597.1 hypothetical protein GOHSU_22_00570 [Gordonia hirsuta DSM 44140 = NBRC 16056]